MKKFLMLVAVFAFVGTAAQAQCTKTASATKKACTKTAAACTKTADAAMAKDLSIVKKVSDSGEVSYARKKTCAASGNTSYTDVKYCTKSKAFVNVAPANAATAVTVAGAEQKVCSKALNAALDANPDVEKRTCAASGKVSYMKKATCAASGKVSYSEVKYCSDSKSFVNVAPKKACTAKEKAACSKSKAACTKGASAKGVSLNADGAKKSCAKTCTKSKAACSGKKATLKAANTDVKVIKTSNQ